MFAALHLLDLPVAAALRDSPVEQRQPWGVLPMNRELDDRAAKLPLLSVNAAARRTGIEAGWALNAARVRCPGLQIAFRQPEAEQALLEEAILLAESLTPDLEVASPDTLILDFHGTPQWLRQALAQLSLRGATLCHAWADTPDLARLAALHPDTRSRKLMPGDLENLDISLLRLLPGAEELLPLLDMWGVTTAGAYLRLPRQQLAERLGPQAGHWHDLLRGKVLRPLKLHRPPESFAQELDLEDEIIGTEPLLFVMKRLLHTLSARLEARHLGACMLHLELRLADGCTYTRSIRLPEPLSDASLLLRPLQTLVEQFQFQAPICGLKLDAEATFPGSVQREWFRRQLPDPARWADTLAQLDGLLGSGKTGIPVPPDSYLSERSTLLPTPGSEAAMTGDRPPPLQEGFSQPDSTLPLRRFQPAQPVVVAHEMIQSIPRPLALLTGPYTGAILEMNGPFSHSGQWWDPAVEWKRLEWNVILPKQKLLRLIFQRPDQWQLEGIYS